MKSPSKVVIVGGGLAAPVLALCLKKQNIDSEIYEMRDFESVDIGDIGLAPNAVRVLDYVGVLQTVHGLDAQQDGSSYDTVHFVDTNWNNLLINARHSKERYGYSGMVIKRHVVRNALREKAVSQGIKINYGMKCIGISEEGDGLRVNFANGESVKSDCVVGADGTHSTVRKHLYPGSDATYSGLTGISRSCKIADIYSSFDVLKGLTFMTGAKGVIGGFITNREGSEMGILGTFEVPDRDKAGWHRLSEDKKEMQLMLEKVYGKAPYPELIRELANWNEPDKLILWPFMWTPPLDHWHSPEGNIILIGDAAHAMPPVFGQGAAAAFEDAATLAYALGRASGSPSQSNLVRLQIWEKHRMDRVKALVAVIQRIHPLWAPASSTWGQRAKEWALWLRWCYVDWWMGGVVPVYAYKAESILPALDA